ncbi:MAG: tetratricopeptide repeat protein [Candidatus Acidiferrales bacterium]
MLEAFVAAHPKDPFARYGLAMECANSGDLEAAVGHFQQLLADNPDYVAGYHQYSQLLTRMDRNDEARKTLATGIEVARRSGNDHARSEMESLLSLIP